jgi:hypothetical protein
MSLDPPAYLFTIQANIRTRPISWEGAMRAKTITDTDLQKIKSIDKVRKEERKQRIEADVQSFVSLLLGGNGSPSIFEAAAKRQDIVQYMLVLTEDLINGKMHHHILQGSADSLQTAPASQQLSHSTPRRLSPSSRCSKRPRTSRTPSHCSLPLFSPSFSHMPSRSHPSPPHRSMKLCRSFTITSPP